MSNLKAWSVGVCNMGKLGYLFFVCSQLVLEMNIKAAF